MWSPRRRKRRNETSRVVHSFDRALRVGRSTCRRPPAARRVQPAAAYFWIRRFGLRIRMCGNAGRRGMNEMAWMEFYEAKMASRRPKRAMRSRRKRRVFGWRRGENSPASLAGGIVLPLSIRSCLVRSLSGGVSWTSPRTQSICLPAYQPQAGTDGCARLCSGNNKHARENSLVGIIMLQVNAGRREGTKKGRLGRVR